MCCIFKICFNGLISRPIVYVALQLVVALIHMIILIIAISPYTHCEKSDTHRHDSLIVYQRLNCSKIDSAVADNAVVLSNKFDLMKVSTAWIILDAAMMLACIIYLIGIFARIKCCISSIFVLPFIAVSGLILTVDIVLMIIWVQTYKHHSSDKYFHQMIGVYDSSSEALLKETMRDEMVTDLITITRIKVTNLFYRLLYHILTVCFLALAIKQFVLELCQIKKDAKE